MIDQAIVLYAKDDRLPFLRSFTNAGGLSEKNCLKVGPSDQPVCMPRQCCRFGRPMEMTGTVVFSDSW